MLEVDSVAPFLLDRGLIDLDWIIEGTLTIRGVARRNRNLRVEGPEGRGLFIKQADDSADGACSTLRCESLFHKFCREEPATADLVPFLPRLVRGLDEEAILVFELIADATTLQTRLAGQLGRGDAIKAARAFGQALGKVHRAFIWWIPSVTPV